MPIALFHHNKLTIATTRWPNHNVHNHSPRIAREVRITKDTEGFEIVWAYFTEIERRHKLVIQKDETWQFYKGKFTIINRTIRNGKMISESKQEIPPLLGTSWTQNNDLAWVQLKLSGEQTAQCIVEQYLYDNVPDPHAYRVTSFDFAKRVANEPQQKRSLFKTMSVRPLSVVLEAAQNDRSESADKWIELFEVVQ